MTATGSDFSGYQVEIQTPEHFGGLVSCRRACPVHTDAGAYVRAIAEGRYEDAYLIARKPNPFASVCGRVCNAPCEAACRRGEIDAPVAIRALKRFVTERFGVESAAYERTSSASASSLVPPGAKRVAVVGAGPAGLACAHDLALAGFAVTVFEAQEVAGGMLVLGVPEYRLPREIVKAEIEAILSLGVEIRFGARIGKNFDLSDLRNDGYKAVFLAIGAHRSRQLPIEGVNLDGVLRAVDYLLNVNLGYSLELGRKVVVIGGGNVAFDAARSVIRQTAALEAMSEAELREALATARTTLDQLTGPKTEAPEDVRVALDAARQAVRGGAREVDVYCLESLSEIPASHEEIEEARAEGIRLNTSWGPRRILGRNGRVHGVEMVKVSRVFDDSGRFNPVFVEGSTTVVDADSTIIAVGQAPDLDWIKPEDGLKVTGRGTIETDPETLATSRDDVFCGGDAAFGPRIIIDAVAEGRQAASSIAEFLGKVPERKRSRVRVTRYEPLPALRGYELLPRISPPLVDTKRRVGVTEVEETYADHAASLQAARCLQCHVAPVFDGDKCILCGGCVDVCPERCLRIVDVVDLHGGELFPTLLRNRYGNDPERGRGAAIIKDETSCIRCGLCAERCPTGAIAMERVEAQAS